MTVLNAENKTTIENNHLTSQHKVNQTPLFTDETFSNLTNALKEIRETTKSNTRNLFFEKQNQEINRAKQSIEDATDFAPSYRKFVNQIINPENIEQAKQTMIEKIKSNNLEGWSPDLQILVNEIMNEENVTKTSNKMIERFTQLTE